MTSPSAETNDPEPPLLKRTDDFWTCSSHWSVGSKPYFSLRILRGGSLNSHMPSSASIIDADTKSPSPIKSAHGENFISPPLKLSSILELMRLDVECGV